MTKILPNMNKHWHDNPPHTENCKHCGAEALLGGQPYWEWWEHYITCSKECEHSKKICSGTSSIDDIIKKWNEENK